MINKFASDDENEKDQNEDHNDNTMNFYCNLGKEIDSLLFKQEEHQIGKILEVKEDMTTVYWMSGSYSDPWHPCKVRGDLWAEDIAKITVPCFRLVELVNKD